MTNKEESEKNLRKFYEEMLLSASIPDVILNGEFEGSIAIHETPQQTINKVKNKINKCTGDQEDKKNTAIEDAGDVVG